MTYVRTVAKNTKWTTEKLAEVAKSFSTRKAFEKGDRRAYSAALRRGVLDEVCSHMRYQCTYWTDEDLGKIASQYKTVKEFIANHRTVYFIAQKRGILSSICAHMTSLAVKRTNAQIAAIAKKYNTRAEFETAEGSVYNIALKRKIIESVCAHMKKPCGTSKEELDILGEIKKLYPKAQKYRDSKVKISGRDFIQGFDIDIYVPELRKGIEFDGTYHHSLSGMKRSRPWWPEEDLVKYHEIKDDYFRSKGISLLHIREADYKINRQAALDQCLSFLRG
jgi:hypothetical protein